MPDTNLIRFLKGSRDTLTNISATSESSKKIHIILGNESCDLDSVVSALCLALLMFDKRESLSDVHWNVLPVLNIPREEYPLKTEVSYLLRGNGIPDELLTFRDDLDLAALQATGRLTLTLVDHHVLVGPDKPLTRTVVSVVDHRPEDAAVRDLPEECEKDIRIVGSCATLVAERILNTAKHLLDHQLAVLIRGTILLDTCCFSTQADRTTPLDRSIVEECEKFGDKESREETFETILSARKDVSSLTSFQILHKDLKVVRGLPLPGMPLLVRDFLTRPDATSALSEFCAKHKSDAAVVIGMSFSGEASGNLQRDLAVYSHNNQSVKKLVDALQSEDNLQLTQLPSKVEGITLFSQGNNKYSRKQILPVVQRVLSS